MDQPRFLAICAVFIFDNRIGCRSYPAIYLSSFKPVKVLKGAFRVGRFATVPRKVLVVLQFSVSVILIIGTVIIFRQIQYTKDRPTGYSRNGLIEVNTGNPELYAHYNELRSELLNTGAVDNMSASSGSVTVQYGGTTDMFWKGKTGDMHPLVMSNSISHDYGKTTGWKILQGRDFSREFGTDSTAMILNEAAVKLMGLKEPLSETVKARGKGYTVIGVIKDMVKESPLNQLALHFYIGLW